MRAYWVSSSHPLGFDEWGKVWRSGAVVSLGEVRKHVFLAGLSLLADTHFSADVELLLGSEVVAGVRPLPDLADRMQMFLRNFRRDLVGLHACLRVGGGNGL